MTARDFERMSRQARVASWDTHERLVAVSEVDERFRRISKRTSIAYKAGTCAFCSEAFAKGEEIRFYLARSTDRWVPVHMECKLTRSEAATFGGPETYVETVGKMCSSCRRSIPAGDPIVKSKVGLPRHPGCP